MGLRIRYLTKGRVEEPKIRAMQDMFLESGLETMDRVMSQLNGERRNEDWATADTLWLSRRMVSLLFSFVLRAASPIVSVMSLGARPWALLPG